MPFGQPTDAVRTTDEPGPRRQRARTSSSARSGQGENRNKRPLRFSSLRKRRGLFLGMFSLQIVLEVTPREIMATGKVAFFLISIASGATRYRCIFQVTYSYQFC